MSISLVGVDPSLSKEGGNFLLGPHATMKILVRDLEGGEGTHRIRPVRDASFGAASSFPLPMCATLEGSCQGDACPVTLEQGGQQMAGGGKDLERAGKRILRDTVALDSDGWILEDALQASGAANVALVGPYSELVVKILASRPNMAITAFTQNASGSIWDKVRDAAGGRYTEIVGNVSFWKWLAKALQG